MDLDLEGRTAVVTGGSSGIGAAIARSLAEEGVSVAICSPATEALERVAPGVVETSRLSTQLRVQARVWGVSEDLALERMVEQIALRKIASARDVADLVTSLVSDRAGLITGTTITIDGGTTKGI